jgi:hypothetical protein
MKCNEAYMDRIRAAQTGAELLQIWRGMAENSFFKCYVNPHMPEEAVNDFIALGASPSTPSVLRTPPPNPVDLGRAREG